MIKRMILPISLLMLIALLPGCGKKLGLKGMNLNVELKPATLTDNLFVNMDYTYKFANDFSPIGKNYKIYTHLWRTTTKEMLLVDDHMPEKPVTQWKAGDIISYKRTLYIPKFLNEFDIDFAGYEEIRLSVGLYNPENMEEEKISLFEKKLRIEPFSTNSPEIVFHTGWHEEELDLKANDPFLKSWRWTKQSAVCIIDNTHTPCTLIIKAAVNKNFIPNQKIIFKINDILLDEFVPEENVFSKEYTISSEMMGNLEEFQLKIETDQAFIPARVDTQATDERELGIQVFFIYIREKI